MNVEAALQLVAEALPCRRILVNGELYLERFFLGGNMNARLAALWPEEERPPVGSYPLSPLTHYLHCFHKPDPDRHLHNHPWVGVSRILCGGYTEERFWLLDGKPRDRVRSQRPPGGTNVVGPEVYHTITELHADRVWTLFSHGPKLGGWGFWVNGKHVPNKEYERTT